MIWQEILSIFGLVLINSAFSLTEMALVTSRSARVRHMADQGHRSYRHLLGVMKDPTNFLSTIQVAISLIGIFAGALGGATLGEEAGAFLAHLGIEHGLAVNLGLLMVVLGTTYLSVVVGELVPKRLALSNPEPIAAVMQYPVRVISVIFFPLVKLLSLSSSIILRIMGVRKQADGGVSQEELRIMAAEGAASGSLEGMEHRLIDEVLLLGERKVTAFMRPRMEVPCVDETASVQELLDFVRRHSAEDALPVVKDDIDHIVAMLDIRLAMASLAARGRIDRKDCFRLPVIIPGSYDALKTLEILAARETQDTAVVLDEFGGVEGIVCLSDILEAMVNHGAAPVPRDPDREPGQPQVPRLPFECEGSLGVSEFCRLAGLPNQTANGPYETAAGFFLWLTGRIPAPTDHASLGGLRFTVLEMEKNRIARLMVELEAERESSPATADEHPEAGPAVQGSGPSPA